MNGKNYSVNAQRCKYVVTDLVMTYIAFFIFNIFRYDYVTAAAISASTLWKFLTMPKVTMELIFVPLVLSAIYILSGYYNNPLIKSRLSEFTSTFLTALSNTLIIFMFMLINDSSGMRSRDYVTIAVLFSLLFCLTYIGRWFITSGTIRKLRKRQWKYTTLIVGNSKAARKVYSKISKSNSVWGYNVIGFISIPGEHDFSDNLASWPIDEVEKVCAENAVDQIILAPEKRSDKSVMALLDRLFPLGKPVKIAPDTLSFVTSGIQMNDILGVPLIDLTSPRMSDFQKNVKRLFDITASSLIMIILSPLLLWIALMVKFGSKGPVIYSQERIGRHQKPFMIYKFRSMRTDAEKEGPQLSKDNDPRITPFGRVMRKYRLDELPQFWNVIRGDMSIVGPRPEREFYIRQIMKEAPYYCLVFQVRPGITSWGMVKYGYASTIRQMVSRSRFDLIYLNNMSLQTDAKIMIHTVKTIIGGEGK